MKKTSILLLISFILISLFSCKNKKLKVAILLYEESDTFISEFNEQLVSKLSELPINFEVYNANNSQSIQNQQISSLIEKDVDLLLINPVDRIAALTICRKAEKQNIPIIFFNREPLKNVIKEFKNVFYVGSDAQNVGRLQAKIAEIYFKDYDNLDVEFDKNQDGIIQYAIIKGEQGHQDAEDRTRYSSFQLIEDNYKTELLATKIGNWRRDKGYEAMNALYQEYEDKIELVFANNDDMALGAIDYLIMNDLVDENNPNMPFLIIGVDGTKVGIKAIEERLLHGTVINSSDVQTTMIIKLIKKILLDIEYELPDTITRKDQYFYDQGKIYQ